MNFDKGAHLHPL